MYDLQGLGVRIRLLRIDRGYTQESFARELGVSAQAVSKWETGAGYPDIGTLPLIAEKLHTSLDALFGEEPEPAPSPAAGEEDGTRAYAETPVEIPAEDAGTEEEEEEGGVRVVAFYGSMECLSDMQPDGQQGPLVRFPDGSTADLLTRVIVNNGSGVIELREIEPGDREPDLGERISRQVENAVRSALSSNEMKGLVGLGERLTARINQMIRGEGEERGERASGQTEGRRVWNGEAIDSLDLSVSGDADVSIECGEPGLWSVTATGSLDFLESLTVAEDGNVLTVGTQSNLLRSFRLKSGANHILIRTGFTEGAELDAVLRGAGDLDCAPSFRSSRVTLMGSGDMDLKDLGNLTCSITGSGDVTFARAANAAVTIRGSGDVEADAIGGVSDLRIFGSGDVRLKSVEGQLSCRCSGSGDLEIDRCALESFRLDSFGAGDAAIHAGTVERLKMELRGAGDFDGSGLTAGELEADLSGASSAVIGRLTGRSTERVGPAASLRIEQRG